MHRVWGALAFGALTKVGENVRARVDAVGLNRQQFATALGITWGNADGIYRGRQCPSVLSLTPDRRRGRLQAGRAA